MNYQNALLSLIEAYSSATGKSEATVANYARQGSRFFQSLRQGARVWPETGELVVQWFSDHWPADADWPDGIIRPEPDPAADAPRRPGRRASVEAAA